MTLPESGRSVRAELRRGEKSRTSWLGSLYRGMGEKESASPSGGHIRGKRRQRLEGPIGRWAA